MNKFLFVIRILTGSICMIMSAMFLLEKDIAGVITGILIFLAGINIFIDRSLNKLIVKHSKNIKQD